LKVYYNAILKEWISRGYKNSMEFFPIEDQVVHPHWLGNEKFHLSHQSNLLRKDFNFYSQFFKNIPNNLEYVWNVSTLDV